MKGAPCVTRRYDQEPDACARALEILLNLRGKKNAAGRSGGEDNDAMKGVKCDRATASIPNE